MAIVVFGQFSGKYTKGVPLQCQVISLACRDSALATGVFDGIADFNRFLARSMCFLGQGLVLLVLVVLLRTPFATDERGYSTPNGALVSAEGILIDLPQAGETCAVSSQSCYIHAEVPTGPAFANRRGSFPFVLLGWRPSHFLW